MDTQSACEVACKQTARSAAAFLEDARATHARAHTVIDKDARESCKKSGHELSAHLLGWRARVDSLLNETVFGAVDCILQHKEAPRTSEETVNNSSPYEGVCACLSHAPCVKKQKDAKDDLSSPVIRRGCS